MYIRGFTLLVGRTVGRVAPASRFTVCWYKCSKKRILY